jgi:hypothetical protein
MQQDEQTIGTQFFRGSRGAAFQKSPPGRYLTNLNKRYKIYNLRQDSREEGSENPTAPAAVTGFRFVLTCANWKTVFKVNSHCPTIVGWEGF